MGQEFGCNCVDRKDPQRHQQNRISERNSRQHYPRELRVDRSLPEDQGLAWLIKNQSGTPNGTGATYVLKHRLLETDCSFNTDSNTSFILNGDKMCPPRYSNTLPQIEALKNLNPINGYLSFYTLHNQEVLHYLEIHKDEILKPIQVMPHPVFNNQSLIVLQQLDWHHSIFANTNKSIPGIIDFAQKRFLSKSSSSFILVYQQIYNYFKREMPVNWSYIGYNFSLKEHGELHISLFFSIEEEHAQQGTPQNIQNMTYPEGLDPRKLNIQTNSNARNIPTNNIPIDFETMTEFSPTAFSRHLNANSQENKQFKGCISFYHENAPNDDWNICIFEREESLLNQGQMAVTVVESDCLIAAQDTEKGKQIGSSIQQTCEINGYFLCGFLSDWRGQKLWIIFGKPKKASV